MSQPREHRTEKRSSSNTKQRSSSGTRPPVARSKQCNVCGSSFNFSTKASECTNCGQATCVKHCLNKWKGQVICDTCHKNFLFSEMLGRGEIEEPEMLKARLNEMMREREKWHEINQQIDGEVVERKKDILAAEAKNKLEIQRLKEHLQNEKKRNEGIVNVAVKLTETVEGSKQCEKLTSSKTRDNIVQLEARTEELTIYKDQVRQLSLKLSQLSLQFQGMISVKQLLATACRSCKAKIRHNFRRQFLEGNFSEALSTMTRFSNRTEMNRVSRTEMRKENCKCILM
eukprot:CAMPEP_0204916088 /NCGR_PEP_ID=MMETSP1397-20131031/13989_1 /ASSEMBLY_ACC=CAM_ASM_000891 /TAXON_ID=49980 /ORGANISM="Climacostomum Climacostomum virens, Strain Stock W-24" /LENGTH=285 /DNA_ID=CAMNT_0052088461 /DNA_START=119 /DNA_END=976 /DNA_ORIENTATION=-